MKLDFLFGKHLLIINVTLFDGLGFSLNILISALKMGKSISNRIGRMWNWVWKCEFKKGVKGNDQT